MRALAILIVCLIATPSWAHVHAMHGLGHRHFGYSYGYGYGLGGVPIVIPAPVEAPATAPPPAAGLAPAERCVTPKPAQHQGPRIIYIGETPVINGPRVIYGNP